MNRETAGYSSHHSERMDAVTAFAGGVAHDFNNLLLVMLVFGDMIRAACPPTDPRLPDITELMHAIERAQALAGELLEFSRQQPSEAAILRLNRMAASLEAVLRRTLPVNIEIVTSVAEDIWPIRADQRQIENVIANLAVAAKDAMPDGGRFTLEIVNSANKTGGDLHAKSSRGDQVALTVSDSGPAIDPALLPRIFEPYFAAKKIGRSTGLGFAACYAAVARAGGTISVSSETGRGTSFTILLPRAADSATITSGATTAAAERPGSQKVILVAEDDGSVMRAATNILRNNGYKVLTASDGEEACRVLKGDGEQIDLVLTDLSMPRLGGPELDRYVKTHWPKMPLVFMSGSCEHVPPEGTRMTRHGLAPSRERPRRSVIEEILSGKR